MKQKFMKKALAVALSTAMVFSASSVSGMQPASAAAKFVGLNTTFKTLKVGQKGYKLRLVNNTQGWKIKKVSTSDKKIATVYGKKASYVLLKGKSEGRATIKVSLKTNVRKKNNTKVLKCRVKVVGAGTATPTPSPDPTPAPTPSQASKTVATQAELTAALADTSLKSITVKTDSTASFTIPAGAHTSVGLTVDAPNADVTNSGVFKSITIAAIKDSTWTENAVGNNFKVDALKARIVVGTGASVTGVSVTKANADVAIVVNGKLASVTISAKAKLALSGSATDSVVVKVQAAGSEVTAEIPVAVEASADATIDLKAKAEKSTVKVTNAAATVTVKNNTTATIEITKPDNKVQKVSPKGSVTIKPATSGSGTSTGSGSYGGGSYYPNNPSNPSNPSTPQSKTYVVYTKDDLTKALADPDVTEIKILSRKSDDNGPEDTELEIPKKSYGKIDLIVDAPQKTITNEGEFKSIQIKNIAPETWIEKAKNNTFTVSAPNPHIVVEKDFAVKTISFVKGIANAITKIKLEIKGTVEKAISFEVPVKNAEVIVEAGAKTGNVEFKAGAENSNISMDVAGEVAGIACDAASANLALTVSNSDATVGTVSVSKETAVAIKAAENVTAKKITVDLNVENAELTSAVPVAVNANADKTVVVLEASAKDSTITAAQNVTTVGISTETAVTVKQEGKEDISVEAEKKGNLSLSDGQVMPVEVSGVKLNFTDIAMLTTDIGTENAKKELTLSLNPANANGKIETVEWSSDNEAVATVEGTTATATVIGKAEGTATITASTTIGTQPYSATCTVTVTKPNDDVTTGGDDNTGDDNTGDDTTQTGLTSPAVTIATQTVTTGSAATYVNSPSAFTLSGVSATATIDGKEGTKLNVSGVVAADTSKLDVTESSGAYTFTIKNDADKEAGTFNVTVTAASEDGKYTVTATVPVTIAKDPSAANGYKITLGTIDYQTAGNTQ